MASSTASALVTFQEQVLHEFDGKRSLYDGVTYFGGNNIQSAQFTYQTTGSRIVVAGIDQSTKVKSTEWDIVFVNETTELTLDDWSPEPTKAAVARAVAQWDGYIGGQARQGRGRCNLTWLGEAPTADAYDRHITDNADAMRDGIVTGTLGTGKVLCAVAA